MIQKYSSMLTLTPLRPHMKVPPGHRPRHVADIQRLPTLVPAWAVPRLTQPLLRILNMKEPQQRPKPARGVMPP